MGEGGVLVPGVVAMVAAAMVVAEEEIFQQVSLFAIFATTVVENVKLSFRPEDLRRPFGQFGPLKDVYLPRDYYSGHALALCLYLLLTVAYILLEIDSL
ncbi:serine/arginine-rich SC35-like splicing factor SCL30A, partial [Tanacetum coccineum]